MNNGETFKLVREELKNLGYYVTEKIINTCEYGNIPQNRERIYIVAFRDKQDYEKFRMPMPIQLKKKIKDEKIIKKL